MVTYLLSIDTEHRRNTELSASTGHVTPNALKHQSTPSITTRRPTTAPRASLSYVQKTSSTPRSTGITERKFSSSEQTRQANATDACYNCSKPGHFKADCPTLPAIKEVSTDDVMEEMDVATDNEEVQEGNGEA